MFERAAHFLQYHNAVPLFLGVLFLGSGVAFASSEAVRNTVFDSQEELRSVDNSRIIHVDLAQYAITIEITNVTQDDDFYYVSYLLNTIDVVDAVWQDVAKERVLQVAKTAILGKDLGTHASKELAQVRDGERVRLQSTQEIERAIGESAKTVATVYTGLVGRFLDEETEVFAGYQAVVEEQPAEPYADHIVRNPQPSPTTDDAAGGEPQGETVTIVGDPGDTEPPTITILGNNPARVALNAQYSDLGAYVSDNQSSGALGYKTFLDGVEVSVVEIDTSTTTTYTITYGAADSVGNTASAQRTVAVFDPSVEQPSDEPSGGPTGEQTGGQTGQQPDNSGGGTTDPGTQVGEQTDENNNTSSENTTATSTQNTATTTPDSAATTTPEVATTTPAIEADNTEQATSNASATSTGEQAGDSSGEQTTVPPQDESGGGTEGDTTATSTQPAPTSSEEEVTATTTPNSSE